MKKLFLFLLLICFGFGTNAQLISNGEIRALFETGYDQLNQFQFVDAKATINKLKTFEKKGNWTELLEINYHYLMMVTGDHNENHEEVIFAMCDQLTLELKDKSDLESLFAYYSALFFKERVYIHNKNYLSASRSLKFYKSLIDSVSGYELKYAGFYLVNGLSELSLYSAEKKLGVGSWLLSLNGANKEKGIALLKKGITFNNRLMLNEAYYFLFKYYLDVEKDLIKAYEYANLLLDLYPNNLKYQYYKALIVEELGISSAAHQMNKYLKKLSENNQLSSSQKQFLLDNPNIKI